MCQKLIFLFLFSFISLFSDPLQYLNGLRITSGLYPFTKNNVLQISAQNHSNYMQQNNTIGHGETIGNNGYTGTSPSDRTQYAGYSSLYIGENVSARSSSVESSIDGLFSAIYHRFGFLSLSYDTVGIGINGDNYTYDLSNSQHAQLCQGDSYAGTQNYYTNACIDHNKHISVTDYTNATNAFKSNAPSLIVWPADNLTQIPPVFYEESPDPLPNDSVTGYPISVEFNDYKFTTPPTVTQFILQDETNTTLALNTTMNKNNDPSGKFTPYQVAIFPQKRLEWGSIYHSRLEYTANGVSFTKKWCFSTKSLISDAPHFYRIQNNIDAHYNVQAGESYAIYIVPTDSNDKINSVSYSYNVSDVAFDYIDSNTIKITLNGAIGHYAVFTFGNGQKITLTIQNSDTASTPKNLSCPLGASPLNLEFTINKTEIINTSTNIEILLGIEKTDTSEQTEALVIRLDNHKKMPLYFNENLQTMQGVTLSNKQWELKQKPSGYALTYIGNNGIFPNNTTMHVGIEATLTPPPHRKGAFTFMAQTADGTDSIVLMQYRNLP